LTSPRWPHVEGRVLCQTRVGHRRR
jgi:hypothetical protein